MDGNLESLADCGFFTIRRWAQSEILQCICKSARLSVFNVDVFADDICCYRAVS